MMVSVFDMESYIESEREKMEITPTMMFNQDEHWIVVESSKENLNKFNNLVESTPMGKVPKNYLIYYNTPDEYAKILEGVNLRAELTEMRERERILNNPPINEGILNITSKGKLLQYLLDERYSTEENLIYENPGDIEIEMAILEAEQDKLKELAVKYS